MYLAKGGKMTWQEKRDMVLEDYWAGRISKVRADEMLKNIENQEKEKRDGQEKTSSND